MKPLYLALLLTGLASQPSAAQTITRTVEPVSHAVRLNTRLIKLRDGLSPSIYLRIRSRGDAWFLYADIETTGIGSQDYIAFVLDADTLVLHSTGPQTGSDNNLHEKEVEYALTREGLQKLAASRIHEIIISRVDGEGDLRIPVHNQGKLIPLCAELLKQS